jgi:hypothetical protein
MSLRRGQHRARSKGYGAGAPISGEVLWTPRNFRANAIQPAGSDQTLLHIVHRTLGAAGENIARSAKISSHPACRDRSKTHAWDVNDSPNRSFAFATPANIIDVSTVFSCPRRDEATRKRAAAARTGSKA